MSDSYWRNIAAPIIAETLKKCRQEGLNDAQTRKALRDAYPFGEMAMHPYKIWRDEIAVQTGVKQQRQLEKARRLVAEHNARLVASGQPMLEGISNAE